MRCMNNIKFSGSKVKNTNYWFLLIFKNFVTLVTGWIRNPSRPDVRRASLPRDYQRTVTLWASIHHNSRCRYLPCARYTLFRRFCQSRSRAYFEVFSIKNQKNFCWAKNILPHYFFLDKGILRSRQSETFKKGHKINIGVFYTKKQTFSQSMFYTKSFKILS